ncbi:MAG: hypothetical protein KDA28_16625, partial [Phycisphaerales bacterium]|nr:hypothetical protein [Phycisphaerales bacterium]
ALSIVNMGTIRASLPDGMFGDFDDSIGLDNRGDLIVESGSSFTHEDGTVRSTGSIEIRHGGTFTTRMDDLEILGGSLIVDGDFVKDGLGNVVVQDGLVRVNGNARVFGRTAVFNVFGGRVTGGGEIGTVNLNDVSTLAPGDGIGTMLVAEVSHVPGATLEIEIGGTTPGIGHDQLRTSAYINPFGSTLSVSLVGGFQPQAGDRFVVVAGDTSDFGFIFAPFDDLDLPDIAPLAWRLDYPMTDYGDGIVLMSSVELVAVCAADLTGDTIVDIFDLVAFVGLLQAGDPGADWDANGVIDIFDLLAFLGDFKGGC